MFNLSAHCWICQLPLVMPTQGICSFCSAACLLKPRVCPCCGLPSEHTTQACGRCIQKAPYWQQLIFVSDYQPPLSQSVSASSKISGQMANRIGTLAPDAVELSVRPPYSATAKTRSYHRDPFASSTPMATRIQPKRPFSSPSSPMAKVRLFP